MTLSSWPDEDREIYHDYLKTNILLWRDKFEDALSPKLPEPSTPEYESEAEEGVTGEEEFDLEGLQVIIVLEEKKKL